MDIHTQMPKPIIKGVFVNSHIRAVHEQLGEYGVHELEKRYGKNIHFRNSEEILVRDEVRIIEHALTLLTEKEYTQEELEFEAGRLHFINFTSTPLAKILFSIFRTNFKLMMTQTPYIAGHVFRGVKFSSEDIDEKGVKVVMENNDYPLLHFKGLFFEWMTYAGLNGTVAATEHNANHYEYVMRWE